MHYPPKGIHWDSVPLGEDYDTAIAGRLGVASQVVWQARRRRGIARFRTPQESKAAAVDWDAVDLGTQPDSVIARRLGVSRRRVAYERKRRQISAFVGLLLTQEDEPCRSVYEAMYDAWLHANAIEHEHGPRVHDLPYIADFLVGGRFIEIVGMLGFRRYREKFAKKITAYEDAGIDVIWLSTRDVEDLFRDCNVELRWRVDRRCLDCDTRTHDLVKGVCRRCYMLRWHVSSVDDRRCAYCGERIARRDPATRFCSRGCYWKSMELPWPADDELEKMLAVKPAAQVAGDIGVKPNALYMRLHRRRLRAA